MTHANPVAVAWLCLAVLAARPVLAQAPDEGPQVSREGGAPVAPSVRGMPGAAMAGTQNPFLGGVPSGRATGDVLPLSLADALRRSLRQNLGAVLGEQARRAAAGARWQALSGVLPTAGLRLSHSREEINLEEFGFPVAPGESPIIGPFNVAAAHLTVSQPLFDYAAIQGARAGSQAAVAAGHTSRDVRDTVVFVTASLYLQAVTAAGRIDAAQAQLNTAQALYDRAVDMKRAGLVAGIEVLRAQVQMQAQEQRLIFHRNELAKATLILQRAVGIPLGQEVQLTDALPYRPLEGSTLEALLEQSSRGREDLQAAAALLKAAEAARQAALGSRLPSVRLNADIGRSSNAWDTLHGTYAVSAAVSVPIFQGGRIRGRVLQADAQLREQQAQLEDLRARVEYEVRSAVLDVQAADQRLQVARGAVDLAGQQLTQAQDRFSAGVANNIEVVQAQEALATATENYLGALYAHNLAKVSLTRAIGLSEEQASGLLSGQPAESRQTQGRTR